MDARGVIWVFAGAAILVAPCRAEDHECRWFIPATGLTVPVRCDGADSQVTGPSPQIGVERGLLGLTLAPLTDGLRKDYGIEPKVSGVIVTQVESSSDAAGQGIVRGDVILQSNDAVVSTPEDVARSVASATNDGRKSIVLHLSSAEGRSQYVTLPL
jgi:serine protease Do